MKIHIITVGKVSDAATLSLQRDFEKRLSRWTDVEWQLVPHGKSVEAECKAILKHIKPTDFVVLLDERGRELSTEGMTRQLDQWLAGRKRIVFVIGGAYGVDEEVTGRADFVWSFSRLVFPHQLMRVLLVEQLYRIFSVRSGGKYHHA